MTRKKYNIRRLAVCGVLTALALTLGYLECLIPLPVGIYGIKLGLANLAVIVPLYLFGAKYAAVINLTRVILSSLLFGNTVSLAYSLAGGALSLAVMILARKYLKLSAAGVSVCGGVAHNTAQLCVAVLLLEQLRIAFYLPVLLICGAITGLLVGICALPVITNRHILSLCNGK